MYIPKNNAVWIISTARKINYEELKPSIAFLKQCNLDVCIGKTIDSEEHQFAGNDELRIQDFQNAINDKNAKAIWCARGGYGTVRIIDKIDFSNYVRNPIPIIGYSDITVIHSHLHNLGVKTIHATMPVNIKDNSKESLKSLKDVLFEKKLNYSIKSSKNNVLGKAKGKLVGGNLSILYSLLGSSSSINTDNKILFIEDIDEYLYHIDRMLINLKRNGYFKNLAGLVVGSFTKMNDNLIPFGKTVEEIVLDITQEYNFPILFNFPAGHTNDNRALIFGAEIIMTVDKKNSTLEFC